MPPPPYTMLVAQHPKATLAVGKWHLGQRDIYLPTSRGFDSYLGIPFSQDIAFKCVECVRCLLALPAYELADLFTIAMKYSKVTTEFITTNAESETPFLVYLPFNHIHGPNSCGARWCGQSKRGPIGDATEEVDWVIGEIMATIASSKAKDDTLVFFTSDNGAPQRP
eukprot:gene21829-24993_t